MKPVMWAAMIKEENSYVELGGDALHVVLGRWFDEKIPVDQITEVGAGEWPWWNGLGAKVDFSSHLVGIIGSLDGVVSLKFKSPQRVHVIVAVDCVELRVSLEEPQAFIKAIADTIAHRSVG